MPKYRDDVRRKNHAYVATALRQSIPESLLDAAQTNILMPFLCERQDVNRMRGFRRAA